jgi:hypothetical protein
MITAREVTNQMRATLGSERAAMAEFLVLLADFDAKQRWRELDYTSCFYYLRREFKLSEGAAHNRKTAAELIQRFPEVADALRSGDLCLSTITAVAKVLTPENLGDVLPRFFRVSYRQAEQLAASLRPAEVIPLREVVTPIRPTVAARTTVPASSSATNGASATAVPALHTYETPAPVQVLTLVPLAALEPRAESVEALNGVQSRFHLTVTNEFLETLQAAKDDFAHVCPNGGAMEVLLNCMKIARAEHAKRKGLVAKPLKTPRPSGSDAIPAHVKRAAWQRAGGRCEFVLESGERCDCTRKLEFDHITPLALGGTSTLENVRVVCRQHNLLAARRVFGDAVMNRYAPGRRLQRS